MTVKELIKKLEVLPGDAAVKTWDPYCSEETTDVYVSTDGKGTVYVMNTALGFTKI